MDGSLTLPNMSRWVVIYPIYINSKKTLAEGRRIGVAKACENPSVVEIGDCCQHLRLPCAIELNKAYSRDFKQRGRVRVQLEREDGTPINPAIPTRKALLLKVAELVSKRHNCRKKQEESGFASGLSSAMATKSEKSGNKKK